LPVRERAEAVLTEEAPEIVSVSGRRTEDQRERGGSTNSLQIGAFHDAAAMRPEGR
jgi:hypothetical protein